MKPHTLLVEALENIVKKHQAIGLNDCPNRLGFNGGIGNAIDWIKESEKQADFQWRMNELISNNTDRLEDCEQNVKMLRRGMISAYEIARDLSKQLWVQ